MIGRPILQSGLAFVPTRDGYVVDGGLRREYLTGRLARDVLPVLFRLMDGTRTVDEIGELLGIPVQPIVDVLLRRGLVRLGAGTRPDPGPLAVFLQRTRPAPMADGTRRRLEAARVTVTGDHLVAELLTTVLRQSGVGIVGRGGGRADLTVAVVNAMETLPVPATGALLPVRTGPPWTGQDPAHASITAGTAAATALRYLGGHRQAGPQAMAGAAADMETALPATAPAKSYLTERRIRLRGSPYPRVRELAWILTGRRHVPAAAPPGALRTYLLGDLTGDGPHAYALDLAGNTLIELPGAPPTDSADVTLVVTGDRSWAPDTLLERGERLLRGDTGVLIAGIADDARSAGWAARAGDAYGPAAALGIDTRREVVTSVLELTHVRQVARPVRRRRYPVARAADLTAIAGRGLARADEIFGGHGGLRHAFRARGALGWIGDYLNDRGLPPGDVLLFMAGSGDITMAAAAAGTVWLTMDQAGCACELLSDLGDHDPSVLYGCVLRLR